MENQFEDAIAPEITGSRVVAEGNWMKLDEIQWKDHEGQSRTWESASRLNCPGAVGIIACMVPSNRLIFIRQFRVPLNAWVIECPAGLMDQDETPEVTALRELYEETGYHGKILSTTPPVCTSPGLTDEAINLIFANVDETLEENQNVTPAFDEGEFIETILVPIDQAGKFIQDSFDRGDQVDAKVMSFVAGCEFSTKMSFT